MALHSGRQLKQLATEGQKVCTTQTASEAVKAIILKFGQISDNKKYYHRGAGIWSVYQISEDRKKTGRIAKDSKHWKSEPFRYDLPKVDTKAGLTVKRAIVPQKKPKHNKNQKVTQKNLFARF